MLNKKNGFPKQVQKPHILRFTVDEKKAFPQLHYYQLQPSNLAPGSGDTKASCGKLMCKQYQTDVNKQNSWSKSYSFVVTGLCMIFYKNILRQAIKSVEKAPAQYTEIIQIQL